MEDKNLKEVNVTETQAQAPAPLAMGVPVKTIALIALLAFIACVLVYIAVSPKKSMSPTKITTTIQQTNQDTSLSISKNQVDPKDPTKYYSEVLIDTGKNKVNAVQIELSFDPTQLRNVDITSGDFFSPSAELLKKIDSTNGTISYAVSVPTGQSSTAGKGVIARIYYSPVSAGTTITTINFRPKTEVSSLEEAGSLLKETNDGIVEIQQISVPPTSTSSAQ